MMTTVDILERAAILTMRRAERRNALSLAMMRELTEQLLALGERRDVQAIVLAGEGPAFSAGHDLAELKGCDEARAREIFDACVSLMETLHRVPQPVVAEVDGVATAAGCQLVAACDLAIASTHASFATPGVRIGLFCSTPMVALTRAIGRKRAMRMLVTGDPIDAETACAWGLVNEVVERERLREIVLCLCRRIAEASRSVMKIGKVAFYEQIERAEGEAYAYTKDVMTRNALGEDAQEGMSAFLAKRPPHWQG